MSKNQFTSTMEDVFEQWRAENSFGTQVSDCSFIVHEDIAETQDGKVKLHQGFSVRFKDRVIAKGCKTAESAQKHADNFNKYFEATGKTIQIEAQIQARENLKNISPPEVKGTGSNIGLRNPNQMDIANMTTLTKLMQEDDGEATPPSNDGMQ